ncbi:NAD-dependent epimerase/dehydratase family protein [Stenotrophomonas sp.]|uniref:NAD-dependent epimerase/dehydratase family protein n=1 Tax=Stenotrophomonas sp. TaxID=69392 RepID=UPI0028B02CC7|nr:NAD-dependent epimerase/dehydratase family protein [Stenotrophomonas sp.]
MENDIHSAAVAGRALVFGGSGQIGEPLLAQLLAAGWEVTAVSRQAHADTPGVHWVQADLYGFWRDGQAFDAVISCGPLDNFARWYAGSDIHSPRVVAFGSTSAEVKQDSAEPAERDVARRLREAEQLLFATAAERGVAATVLRPTLIYGAGRDKTLTSIARMAQRTRLLVLPTSAKGMRQPVHVQDLAKAVLQVLPAAVSHGRAYAVGGGEVLPYNQMVRRVLATLRPRPLLLRVPTPLFVWALRKAHGKGRLLGMNEAVLERMRDPLAFDIEPARRDFGYAPRAFLVQRGMFVGINEGAEETLPEH